MVAFFCCVLWGSASPAIKIAYDIFSIGADDTASRLMLAGARFFLAGIMTIAFGSFIGKGLLIPGKEAFKYIVILSMFQTVGQYFFFFMALAHITGVRGSIINASGNFFAILFAAYLFHFEKFTLNKLMGCVVGFLGIILIFGGSDVFENSGGISLYGEGAMLLAAVFYALSSCCIKIYARNENPVTLSGYQFMFGGAVLFLVGFLGGGHLIFSNVSCVLNLFYMGFISAGAYTLWGILLKHNPVSRVSILGFMNPVMGVILSALFLGENKEAFSATGLAALIMVVIGIIIVNNDKQYGITRKKINHSEN